MKKSIIIQLLLTLFVMSTPLLGQVTQEVGVRERVYVSTDKNCYIAGDYIWCSLFCFDVTSAQRQLSSFSSIAYLELHSLSGVAQTLKIALIEGRGAGCFKLSSNLPTGNYYLLGYTKQNKNEQEFVPMGKMLTIFNVLSSEKVAEGVVIDQEKAVAAKPEKVQTSPQIEMLFSNKENFKKGEKMPIEFRNLSLDDLSATISIYHRDTISALDNYAIGDYFLSKEYNEKGMVERKHIPDYEGEVIEMKVKTDDENLFNSSNIFVSFPGLEGDIYSSKVDSDGYIKIFTKNIYGRKDMICEPDLQDTTYNWSIELQDPFIRKRNAVIPILHIDKSMTKTLEEKGIAMQLSRRFEKDTLYEKMTIREGAFLSSPKIVYHLDNYTRFPIMQEVITEFVTELRTRKFEGKTDIRVMCDDVFKEVSYTRGTSLLLLDGIPIFNHDDIIGYDPLLVKDLKIYTNGCSIGNAFYEGVASFVTYKGNLPSYTLSDKTKVVDFEGASTPMSFTGKKIPTMDNYPDYRQTIYWNPIVEVKASSSYIFDCIAPMYEGEFVIFIEGVTSNGEPVYYKNTFFVR